MGVEEQQARDAGGVEAGQATDDLVGDQTRAQSFDAWDNESITAQDVIDALRLALTGQKDPAEQARLMECLLEFAPQTDGDRGSALLLRLISEGSMKVELS